VCAVIPKRSQRSSSGTRKVHSFPYRDQFSAFRGAIKGYTSSASKEVDVPKTVDPKEFWENKILTWENGRYAYQVAQNSLEGLADKASNSLRFRLQIATRLLSPYVAGRTVVDIGCGSGLVAENFIKLGAKNYVGFDIAENAVDAGNCRLQQSGISDRAYLKTAPVTSLPEIEADVVFSLGLLDWLTHDEISAVLKYSKDRWFLHAISEKRFSFQQLLHRLYVQISYGHKTGSYRPQYHSINEINELAGRQGIEQTFVYRNPKLSFGAFVMSFDPAANVG